MNGHPGGEENTRRMLALAGLPRGARVLDLGAGAGETLALLRGLGFRAEGLDLSPRSPLVDKGDLLHTPYPDGSFDGVLSQCAFFASGDVPGALRESARLLKPGGTLLLADVFFEDPASLLEAAGLRLVVKEDWTSAWREYYLRSIWEGTAEPCPGAKGKSQYWMLIGRKV